MHLLVPFASALAPEALQVIPTLAVPNLARLLARLQPVARDDADAYTMSPPHERALAAAWGWPVIDGAMPFAATAAAADGIDVGDAAWGLVTPAHWHVGRDHITMADPAALGLDEAESRALFDALRELFEGDGYRWVWGAAERWYVAKPSLAELQCASLDRVIGRNVDFWLGSGARRAANAMPIRRLQSEVQLLLYAHPINDAREARGELAVNSFWLSGCGIHRAADPSAVTVESALRRPLLDGDAAAWATAWSAFDTTVIAALLRDAERANGRIELTLCGERNWQRFENLPRSLWQRVTTRADAMQVRDVLQGL